MATRLQKIREGNENAEFLKKITDTLAHAKTQGETVFQSYKGQIESMMDVDLNLSSDIIEYYINKAISQIDSWVSPKTGLTVAQTIKLNKK